MSEETNTTMGTNTAAPQPPTAGGPAGAPSPMQKISKLPKQTLIIGAVVAAVVIVGLVAVLSGGKVSKEDYREAVEVGNGITSKASSSISDVTSISYISSYTTETQLENNIEDAEDSLKEYQDANKKLDGLKALKDKDVKAKYDTYMTKYNAYVAFSSDYISSAKKALPAVITCEDISSASISDVASFKAAIAPCLDALDDASDVKDKDLKAFIKAYKENTDKVSSLVDQIAGLSTSDYAKRSELRTQLYDLTSEISDAQKDANSNIEKKLKDVNPRDSFNDFGEELENKQRA